MGTKPVWQAPTIRILRKTPRSHKSWPCSRDIHTTSANNKGMPNLSASSAGLAELQGRIWLYKGVVQGVGLRGNGESNEGDHEMEDEMKLQGFRV